MDYMKQPLTYFGDTFEGGKSLIPKLLVGSSFHEVTPDGDLFSLTWIFLEKQTGRLKFVM